MTRGAVRHVHPGENLTVTLLVQAPDAIASVLVLKVKDESTDFQTEMK